MSEKLSQDSNNQPSNWEQAMKDAPAFEHRDGRKQNTQLEELQTEIDEIEQTLLDIQNGTEQEYRPKQKGESIDDYSEYLLSYLRGEAMIENAQQKSESKTACAQRLTERYNIKRQHLIDKLNATETKAA